MATVVLGTDSVPPLKRTLADLDVFCEKYGDTPAGAVAKDIRSAFQKRLPAGAS
jgi:hypothetical protein